MRVERGKQLDLADGFVLRLSILITRLPTSRACLITRITDQHGWALILHDSGALVFEAAAPGDRTGQARLNQPLYPLEWYTIELHYAASGMASLRAQSERMSATARRELPPPSALPRCVIGIGALPATAGDKPYALHCFDGKIDSPRILATTPDQADIARWRFDLDHASDVIHDDGPYHAHGQAVNWPVRAVTGAAWNGKETNPCLAPDTYSAISFHHDALDDAAWEPTTSWSPPPALRSGVYGARVTGGDLVDVIPFVVTPPRGRPSAAPVVVLLPWFTYLAYANNRLDDDVPADAPPLPALSALHRLERAWQDWLGPSTYDHFADGTGCCFGSGRRPMPALRPNYLTRFLDAYRHFPAELYLIEWLSAAGIEFDCITDAELDRDGASTIDGYRCLITGSHPEYVTAAMLDALETFRGGGGNIMYLGGNGFYWVTTAAPDAMCVEVRRGHAGSRTWTGSAGESHHAMTGELGGLWRHRGRPSEKLVGIRTAAFGSGGPALGYRRTPLSYEAPFRFVFEGVDEEFGCHGAARGGAAGDEIDHAVPGSSPPDTAVLATARGFSPFYRRTIEDIPQIPAEAALHNADDIRADIVLVCPPDQGRVFSVGSISWTGALAHNGFNNDVARITYNVLSAFTDLPPQGQHQHPV